MYDLASALGKILADITTKTTNQALHLDPGLRERLHALEGYCVEIRCTLPAVTWNLNIANGTVSTLPGKAVIPQVTVHGTAVDLAGWLTSGNFPPQLEITGDKALLIEFIDILHDFNPELSSPVNSLFSLAGTSLNSLQSLIKGFRYPAQDSADDGFIQQQHLNSLLRGIDELRARIDRLAAGVAQQEQSSQRANRQ